ncbi:MAG: TraR/DksA family transcriptional regulator [Deltaproteobacteria bacterium]|nr:TraR/DksA family transcriptional regulator [Deltaproteobacteria bacterium]
MSKGDKERKGELRKMLVELRNEILNKIAQDMGAKLGEDPRMSTISTMDIGDLSQLDLDGDIDYTILNMYIERLRNIEDALDRLEEGTYGYCEDCGRPIKLERLKVLPFTKYCVQCQEQREKIGQESKLKKMKRGEEFEL